MTALLLRVSWLPVNGQGYAGVRMEMSSLESIHQRSFFDFTLLLADGDNVMEYRGSVVQIPPDYSPIGRHSPGVAPAVPCGVRRGFPIS
jgi:hypothetical protein